MKNLPGYVSPDIDPKEQMILFESLTKESSRQLTICEQLRFMYDVVHQIEDEQIRRDLIEKLIVALLMAKKMNSRLADYKRRYIDKTGHRGKSLIKLEHTRERERLRRAR